MISASRKLSSDDPIRCACRSTQASVIQRKIQTTQIDCVNHTAYMAGEHKYMFDEENLLYILESSRKGL